MNHHYGYNIGVPVPPTNAPPIPVPEMRDVVYEIPVSTQPSPSGSRATSRARRATAGERDAYISYSNDYRDKHYYADHLSVRGAPMGRSNSVGHYRGARIEVGDSRSGRPRSTYDEPRGRTAYHGNRYPESAYSSSSRGSPERSRGPPYRGRRSPSCHSCDGLDYPPDTQLPYPSGYWPPPLTGAPAQAPAPAAAGTMTLFNPNVLNEAHPGLEKKIEDLQKQLERSKLESERLQKEKEAEMEAAKRSKEIEKIIEAEMEKRRAADEAFKAAKEAEHKRIQEEARRQREAEETARRREEEKKREIARMIKEEEELKKMKEEAERLRIVEEARKLKEKEEAEKAKKEADEKKLQELVQQEALKLIEKKKKEEEELKVLRLDLTKPTYTKFSKAHLCKEALDERSIAYTEQEDSFLVHRWVDRDEQQALWNRTKEIRSYQQEYQRLFKEAADKAPIIQTPTGPVKIVKVGNHPAVTVPVVMVTKKANKTR